MTESKVTLILGKRGSGKSFFLKKILSAERRFLVYDTLGEYSDGVVFTEFEDLGRFWKDHIFGQFRLVYQPLRPQEEFEKVCNLVYICGGMVFAAEEIDTFCRPNEISLEFANVIQRGRHKAIDFYGISQRPYGINRIISSQAKRIITFQQSEPRDLDYLSMYIGKELSEKVRDLDRFCFLDWNSSGDIGIKKYDLGLDRIISV